METADQIRVKITQMKLSSLQTEYCNTNWAYTLKIKALRQELNQQNKKQMLLTSQIESLKSNLVEHNQQIKSALEQINNIDKPQTSHRRVDSGDTNPNKTVIRKTPQAYNQGMFFRLAKEGPKTINLSPMMTKTPSTDMWQKTLEQVRKKPQKRRHLGSHKSQATLIANTSQKTLGLKEKTSNQYNLSNITKKKDQKMVMKNCKDIKSKPQMTLHEKLRNFLVKQVK